MLEILHDEIMFDGVTVGKLVGGWPTLRDRVVDIIDGAEEGWISESDHVKAIEEAGEAAIEEGKELAREEAESKIESELGEKYEEGFEHGRAAAILDMKRGQDVARVEALLLAVSEAHDLLFAAVRKRYPTAKLGELKDAARLNVSKLRRAVQAWREPLAE